MESVSRDIILGKRPIISGYDTFDTFIIKLEFGADLDALADDGSTALIYCCRRGYEDAVRVWLVYGANVNIRDERGMTALIYVSKSGNMNIVRLLLDYGADPNILDNNGWSAVMIASLIGHKDVVRLLLERGADPRTYDSLYNKEIRKPWKGREEIVELLVEYGFVR